MPYKVYRENNKYCVWKVDEADNQVERVAGGCHTKRTDAVAHLRALYAAENDEKAAKFSSITYNGITVQATGRRAAANKNKKYERTVRYKGQERTVAYGDPDMEMRNDNDERRAAFNARHSCSEKKDPFAPGFWACYDWRPPGSAKKATTWLKAILPKGWFE